MTITRDQDFPPAIAQLVESFNRCADGHSMAEVLEAAGNMLSAAIHNFAARQGMSDEQAIAFARQACKGVFASVEMNWKRQHKATDVEVKVN